jgi:hypothetical protein
MDRINGIAGILIAQILPPGDPEVTNCLLELETELYARLRDEAKEIVGEGLQESWL